MSEDRRKRREAGSYDPVAAAFAQLSLRVSRPLAEAMARRVGVRPGDRLLDVGTGSGIVATVAGSRIGDGRVVGIDLSSGMLREARLLAPERTLLVRGDAEILPFPDRSFDRVTALFALTHLPRPERCLEEIHRVLRPGGTTCLGVGSRPPLLSPAGWARRLRLLVAMARGGCLLAPRCLDDVVRELLPDVTTEAVRSPLGPRPLAALLPRVRAAGLVDVETGWAGGLESLEDAEQFWRLQSTFSTFARQRLEAVAAERVAAVRERVLAQARATLARGGSLLYPYGAGLVTARRRS